MTGMVRWLVLCGAVLVSTPAWAGPPFLTDDPDPTPDGHYEIYLFASGARAQGDLGGAAGLDFNYGAGPDLQLTATLPVAFEKREGGALKEGLGNVELAAKFRIAHQEKSRVNVAVFPRVFLPAGSHLGDGRAAFLLPVWIGRNGEDWSAFGGGGCALHRGGGAKNFCIEGAAATHRFGRLQLGGEVFHQSADADDAVASTIAGAGLTFDASDHLHFLSWWGAEVENPRENGHGQGYASVLFTF